MHIGFLQTRFAEADVGGGEIHTQYLARELERCGHRVTIHTTRPTSRRDGLLDLDVREYPVPSHKNPIAELWLARKARKSLRDCDVGILTDESAWGGVDLPVPTIMVFHLVWHGWVDRNRPISSLLAEKPQALVYRWMEKKIATESDRIVSISPNMYEDILRIADVSEKVRKIPNGVDVEHFTPGDEKYDEFTVYFQGRLIDMKNPGSLVEAANESDRPWRLVVGGKGPLEDELAALVDKYGLEDRIDLVGYLDDDELLERYRRSHVYALPSAYEGMPLTVLEAAACGTSILASPRAATDFVDDEIGWIVPPVPDRLANRIDSLYDREAEVIRRGKNAREKAENYSWEKVAAMYEDLLHELVSDGAS